MHKALGLILSTAKKKQKNELAVIQLSQASGLPMDFSVFLVFLFSSFTVAADKHKFQRFLTADAALVVTVYAPITFPPASVLLFKQKSNGKLSSRW
jgi:hypothetical protein